MRKLAVLLALLLAVPIRVHAAEVTFRNMELTFASGSGYAETDLFENFKDVMPGDRLCQRVQIKNTGPGIHLYMQVVAHDPEENPLTYSEEFEAADGKDQSGSTGQRDETAATMEDFLKQLTMRIYQGEKLIYEASPGIPSEPIPLGTLRKGQSVTLQVELDVPIDLGNQYANRVGEVDWVFRGEENTDDLIQTGQLRWPVPVLGGLGLLLILGGAVSMRKRNDHA